MDNIGIRLEVTDDQVTKVINDIADASAKAQGEIDGIGKKADATSKKVASGFKEQEAAIVASTRASSDYQRTIDDNKKKIDLLNKSMEEEQKILKSLEKQYKNLGDKSTAEAKKLKNEIDLLDKSIRDAKDDTQVFKQRMFAASDAMKGMAKETSEVSAKTKEAGASTGSLANKVKGLLGRLGPLAVGFGAVVAVIAAVIALPLAVFLSKSQDAADFLAEKMAFLSGAIGEVVDRLFSVGEALVGWVTGVNDGAAVAEAFSKAVSGIGSAMNEAGQAAVSYAAHLKQLKAEQDEFIVSEGEVLAVIDERRRVTADETKTFSSRRAALKEAMTLEKDLERQRLKFAEERLIALRNESQESGDGRIKTDAIEAVNKAERELIDLRRDAAGREAQDQQELISLNKEATEAYKARQKAIKDLEEESASLLAQLTDIRNADASGVLKILIDTEKAVAQVGKLETSLRELYEERGLEFDLAADFENAIKAVEQRGTNAIREFNRKQNLEAAKEAQVRLDAQRQADVKLIGQREELALTLVDIDRKQGLTEVEAEQAKQREKLGIQVNFTRQRLALLEDQNSIEAALYRANIESLKQEIEGLGDVDLTGVKTLGDKIQAALGLTDADFQNVSTLFSQFGSTIIDSLTAATQAQIDQQDQLIDSLNERVDETGSALERELALQEQGFANDAALYQEKLAADQIALEQAEAKKLALQKKQARQQLKIDAAQQASSYLTTVFNLLASESKLGIVGLIAVAAGGLALIGSITAKAKANAAKFSTPGFRYGTEYVTGEGTGTSDSINARLGLGERVVRYEDNQILGGASTSNSDLVKYFQLGKQAEATPMFASVDSKARAVIQHGKELSALEKEQSARLMSKMYEQAASKASKEMIDYWKSRPVTYSTKDGTVREYTKGGVLVRQNIKAR